MTPETPFSDEFVEEIMEIEVGSVYRIDLSKLSTTFSFPVSLYSVKAVLVEGKSDKDVTLLFPSTESLEKFFSDEKPTGSMQPNLNEKYVVGLNSAKKILIQKIPFEEFAIQRGNQSFWAVDFDHDHDDQKISHGGLEIKWAKRKRTTFYCKHSGDHGKIILPCVSVKDTTILKNFDDHENEENEDYVDDQGKEENDEKKIRTLRKRKCNFKGVKYVGKKKKKQKIKNNDQKKFIDAQHRWTVERYKQAEKNMLQIMKDKGAVPGNPILRPDLRSEARKLIGDTGLLDHLLKHMAGKLAPGGNERFRRRHNPEGAMEYWLESADLVDIRKKEGIDDPFWVPPPGWKPGDCPTQDPVCAQGLKELREEVTNMKREIENLACQRQENSHALMTVPTGTHEGVESFKLLRSLKPHLQAMYAELLKKKAQVEKQLSDISTSLSGMEEEVSMLRGSTTSQEAAKETKRLVEGVAKQDKNNKVGALNEAETSQDKEKEIEKEKEQELQQQQQKEAHKADGDDNNKVPTTAAKTAISSVSEDQKTEKEERRQRLRSGFRICKPLGTFLWPSQFPTTSSSSSTTSQVMAHIEDLLGYPTPPSVTSSSYRPPLVFHPPPFSHHGCRQGPPSPVKRPVAKRASVTLTFATATTIRGTTTIDNINIASPTDTTGSNSVITFVPDLNEAPLSPFT